MIEKIKEKQALLISLKDAWLDLSDENPYSDFLLTVMAGVNQLESDLIRMRQKEGIALAKKRSINAVYGKPRRTTLCVRLI